MDKRALADMRHDFVAELVSAQAFDSLHSAAVAAWHLQRVLAKKRDPLSHTLFSDALEAAGAPSPLEHFWCGLSAFAALDGCTPALTVSFLSVCKYEIWPGFRVLTRMLSPGSNSACL